MPPGTTGDVGRVEANAERSTSGGWSFHWSRPGRRSGLGRSAPGVLCFRPDEPVCRRPQLDGLEPGIPTAGLSRPQLGGLEPKIRSVGRPDRQLDPRPPSSGQAAPTDLMSPRLIASFCSAHESGCGSSHQGVWASSFPTSGGVSAPRSAVGAPARRGTHLGGLEPGIRSVGRPDRQLDRRPPSSDNPGPG